MKRETYGERFRRLREWRGLSRSEVARFLQTDRDNVGLFERDQMHLIKQHRRVKFYRLERRWAFAQCRSFLALNALKRAA